MGMAQCRTLQRARTSSRIRLRRGPEVMIILSRSGIRERLVSIMRKSGIWPAPMEPETGFRSCWLLRGRGAAGRMVFAVVAVFLGFAG